MLTTSPMKVSLVVPCFNEEGNVPRLIEEIDAMARTLGHELEVILVDDGSKDSTPALLKTQAERDPRYKAILFRRNFGQTAAMVAGFDHATGDVIVPLDADLQNDPADVLISRRFPSVLANRLIARVGGVSIHDFGCTLKAYRRSVLENVNLYGEMHRFIVIHAAWAGARVGEIVVNHRPRTVGVSNYGIGRTFKVLLDLLTVKLLGSYATKPIYFFGFYGFMLLALGMVCGLGVVGIKIAQQFNDFAWQHTFSLGLLGAFLILVGTQSVMLGLLAELQVRTYHESQHKPIYIIKEAVGLVPAFVNPSAALEPA